MKTKAVQLQFRSGTASALRNASAPFAVGEPVYATDAKILKIGDGSHGWDALPAMGATAEHYALRGEVTGDGGQELVINVGTADVKELFVGAASTGIINVPVGSLLTGYVNFGTGDKFLNYMGADAYYLGSYYNNHNLQVTKTLVSGNYIVKLKFYSSGNPGYARWVNGMRYYWAAVPTAAQPGGGGGYDKYYSVETTPSSTTSLEISGIGFEPKRAIIIKKTGQGTPARMEPLTIFYYDDVTQQPSAIQPGQAYVMYINGSGAWTSSVVSAVAGSGTLQLDITNALVFRTTSTYVCSFYG